MRNEQRRESGFWRRGVGSHCEAGTSWRRNKRQNADAPGGGCEGNQGPARPEQRRPGKAVLDVDEARGPWITASVRFRAKAGPAAVRRGGTPAVGT